MQAEGAVWWLLPWGHSIAGAGGALPGVPSHSQRTSHRVPCPMAQCATLVLLRHTGAWKGEDRRTMVRGSCHDQRRCRGEGRLVRPCILLASHPRGASGRPGVLGLQEGEGSERIVSIAIPAPVNLLRNVDGCTRGGGGVSGRAPRVWLSLARMRAALVGVPESA